MFGARMAAQSRHLVIFGCGYVGTAVAAAAARRGWTVTALTRNPATAATLSQRGVTRALVADLAADDWHGQVSGPVDYVLNSVGSGGGAVENYRRAYVEGMNSIAKWLKTSSAGRPDFAYTSSTSVYPKSVCGTVDEATPTSADTPHVAQLLEAERIVEQRIGSHCARWFVLRLAGIYGPGRHRLLDVARSGEWLATGADFNRPINLTHLDDIVGAVIACFDSGTAPSGLYNVADGQPASRQEILQWLCQRLGKPGPETSPPEASKRRRIDTAKLARETAWRARHPDFRSGYEAILAAR
jgi:nucleoside-diphosphate-sugar epimerase